MAFHADITDEAVRLTRELVRIPSENRPAGKNEQDVHSYLCGYLDERRVAWQSQVVSGDRKNLVVNFPSPGRPRLLVVGHMDTVTADGMPGPFEGRLEDNRILGRGSCDAKGPLATALVSLLAMQDRKVDFAYDTTFAATCDEEAQMQGSKKLAEIIGQFDLCIAMEPTSCRVITAHKGVLRVVIETCGKAAHSSRPENGVNAIEKILPICAALKEYGRKISAAEDARLGRATLSMTQIHGGVAANMLPDRCELSVDIRLLPHQEPAEVLAEVKELCKPASVQPILCCSGISSDMEQPIIKSLRQAAGRHGADESAAAVQYCTDCSQLVHLGQCIVWGPGDIAQAHTQNEFIEVTQIDLACRILQNFLLRS